MRKSKRIELYHLLIQRDGDRCRICHVSGYRARLVVDHIDNDSRNNELSNLQLLCRTHNYRKNPRPLKTIDSQIIQDPKPQTFEMRRNIQAEPKFRAWLWAQLTKRMRITEGEAINSGSEVAGISPLTARRYLSKVCSAEGWAMTIFDDLAETIFVQLRGRPGGREEDID